jgi:hypothetical protein
MPFKSQKQRAWMYSQKPEMAKRWESETPKKAKLPEYVGNSTKSEVRKRGRKPSYGG